MKLSLSKEILQKIFTLHVYEIQYMKRKKDLRISYSFLKIH